MEKQIEEINRLAQKAFDKKEVPIGAIIIDNNGKIIGRGYNLAHAHKDSTEHAEIRALKSVFKHIGDWRLDKYTLIVNLEPCLMCLGAIANARIKKVVYFLDDPLFGSVESKLTSAQLKKLFPKLKVEKIKDKGETKKLLQDFFEKLRDKK